MDRTLSWRRLTASFEFIGRPHREIAAQFGIGKRYTASVNARAPGD
jgi:hypothetical protein